MTRQDSPSLNGVERFTAREGNEGVSQRISAGNVGLNKAGKAEK
jgi:hypothetical protein